MGNYLRKAMSVVLAVLIVLPFGVMTGAFGDKAHALVDETYQYYFKFVRTFTDTAYDGQDGGGQLSVYGRDVSGSESAVSSGSFQTTWAQKEPADCQTEVFTSRYFPTRITIGANICNQNNMFYTGQTITTRVDLYLFNSYIGVYECYNFGSFDVTSSTVSGGGGSTYKSATVTGPDILSYLRTDNPSWTWAADFSSATATFVSLDGSQQEVSTDNIISSPVGETCKYEAGTKYIASVEWNGLPFDGYIIDAPQKADPSEHLYGSTVSVLAPSCTTRGANDQICSECGEVIRRVFVDVLGHDFSAWTTVTAAQCATNGLETRVCSRCNYTESRTVAMKGHSYGAWTTRTEAVSCSQPGEQYRVCSVCGFEQTSPITISHTYGSWTITTVSASCVQAGEKTRVCSVCGEEQKQSYYASHTYPEEWTVEREPTCTANGLKARECTVCQARQTGSIAALGHDYSEAQTTVEPTCGAMGQMSSTCSRCGNVFITNLPKLGGGSFEVFNSGLGEASAKKYTTSSPYNFDTASLTNNGCDLYSTYSAAAVRTIRLGTQFAALQDNYTSFSLNVYAYDVDRASGEVDGIFLVDDDTGTRTRIGQLEGNNGTWSSTDIEFSVSLITKGHNYHFELTEEVSGWVVYVRKVTLNYSAPAHTFGDPVRTAEPTCTAPGTLTYTCTVCGETKTEDIPATGHSYGPSVETKAPTCTERGVMTATCSSCGGTQNTYSSALGHDPVAVSPEEFFYFNGASGYVCARCGEVYQVLFDSGRLSGSSASTYHVDNQYNYDEASVSNGGYDLICNYMHKTSRLGLAFTPSMQIPEGISIYASLTLRGSIIKSMNKATISIVDAQTGVSTELRTVTTDKDWDVYTVSINRSLLEAGHSYYLTATDNKIFSSCIIRSVTLKAVDPENHRWNNGEVTVEATCEQQGTYTYTCADCGQTFNVNVAPLGHDYVSQVVSEATCSQNGLIRTECTRCGDSYEQITTAEHVYDVTSRTAPVCGQTDGNVVYTCSVCGDTYTQILSADDSHDYAIVGNSHATTTQDGCINYRCTICGDEYTETIPRLGEDSYVLVLGDRVPWGKGSESVVLNKLVTDGYITGWNLSTTDDFPNVDLTGYSIIYIPNDQTTATYNKLAAYKTDLESFASNGGVVIYGTCEYGWANGVILGRLPGDVIVNKCIERNTYIVDFNHHIVTGALTDLKPIDDELLYSNYVIHTCYDPSTLPANSHVIMQNAKALPTLVEFPYGNGHIILSSLTWEWGYVVNYLKMTRGINRDTYSQNAFDDLFVYGLSTKNHTEHTYKATNIISPTCSSEGSITYTCKVCGETEVSVTPATGHAWGAWSDDLNGETHSRVCANDPSHVEVVGHVLDVGTVITAATCSEEGEVFRTCVVCGAEKNEIVEPDPTNHADSAYEIRNAVDATCTEPGYSGDKVCLACGETIIAGSETEPVGHDWDKWTDNGDGTHSRVCKNDPNHIETVAHEWDNGDLVKTATCCETGSMEYDCTVCGAEKTEEITIDSSNHADYETTVLNAVEATCGTAGYTGDVVCTGCGEVLVRGTATEKLAHIWGEWKPGENGTHFRTCVNDPSHTETEAHSWDDGAVAKVPTCKEEGTKVYSCVSCAGVRTETLAIDPSNHADYGTETVNAADATCTVEGYTGDTVCLGCSAVLESGSSTGYGDHDWGEWTSDGTENHIRVCSRSASHTETEAHAWDDGVLITASTCSDQGVMRYTCSVCGGTKNEFVVLDSANHADYGTRIINEQSPTCTLPGYTGDVICNGCNAVLIPGTEIEALGHDYHKIDDKCLAPDYGVEGYDYYECSRDPEHNYKTIVDALVRETYTVTFTADGEIVAVVTYTQGDRFIEEPAPPERANYTVEWSDYDLNDENLVVNAVYTPIDVNNVSELNTEKKVDAFENGVANITLTASAASRLVKFESTSTKPVDVILVLDLSGSMAETLGNSETTKLDSLKDCTLSFLTALNDNAVATGADHRVALVGFASGRTVSGYSGMTAYQNTGLIVTNNTGFVSYTSASDYYDDALMSTGNILGVNSKLVDAVNGLTSGGSTNTHLGLKMAQNILAQTGGDGREKVVVLITDGNPTSASSHRDEIQAVAPLAVTYANEIKALGVKLYTVGVDAAADAAAEFDNTSDGITGTGRYDKIGTKQKEVVTYDFNRFLNIVSSNYPDAVAMNSFGDKVNDGYYMSVNNAEHLSDIFSKILVSSVYKKLDFYRCNLVDTLSSDFTLTLEQENTLRDRLASEYGIADGNISVSRNADGTTTIRISGVPAVKTVSDGKTAYVAQVSFEASLNKTLPGVYATNTAEAYVEVGDERVASFALPEEVTVESERNIVVFTLNGEVYRIYEGSLGDVISAPQTELAQWNIDEGTVISGSYAEFEASNVSSEVYTVTWDVNGEKTVEEYSFGEVITVPEVEGTEELDFTGFSPAVPHTMPARNMVFTAIYSPKHVHAFKQTAVKGTCTDGLVIVSECSCGEISEERLEPTQHRFSAIVGDAEGNTLVDTLVCSVCHKTEQHTLTFQTRANGRGQTYMDLNLEKAGTSIQPAEGSTIKIMVPWTNQGYNNPNVTVYRVNEQGVQKTYSAKIENGYLVFYADHFSMYVVEELESASDTVEPVSYAAAVCDLNGNHSYEETTVASTCTSQGVKTYRCPACGDTYTENTAALGHDFRETERVEPTCVNDGYILYVCSRDASHTKRDTLNATGVHKDDDNDGICDVCRNDIGGHSGTDEPSQTDGNDQNSSDVCKFCGEKHTGFFGKIVQLFHNIAYFFKHLFG